jgi:hypothetical protein
VEAEFSLEKQVHMFQELYESFVFKGAGSGQAVKQPQQMQTVEADVSG